MIDLDNYVKEQQALIAAQEKATYNTRIEAQRQERYKAEVDIYAVRLFTGEVTKEFVLAIKDKIKSELPYEVE